MIRVLIVTFLATRLAISADTKPAELTEKHSDGSTSYTYIFPAADLNSNLLFHLEIESAFSTPSAGSTMVKINPTGKCVEPCYQWVHKANEQPKLIITTRTADSQSSQIAYTTDDQEAGEVTGPKPGYDPEFFSVLLGAGTLLTTRGATDYKIIQNNQTLSATNLGRNNVDLIVGGSFNLGIHKGGKRSAGVEKPWSAFISLKFTPGSQDTINGFVFGGGYRITKYLDIVAGVGLTPRNEPSIGLRRVAFNTVTDHPADYVGFIASDLLLLRGHAPFDGFPLQRNGAAIYQGDPLVRHYRAGAFVGVAFPINLRSALGGK